MHALDMIVQLTKLGYELTIKHSTMFNITVRHYDYTGKISCQVSVRHTQLDDALRHAIDALGLTIYEHTQTIE